MTDHHDASFTKYLAKYCLELSGEKSLNLHKHCQLAETNRRLLAPFCLYCVLGNHTRRFFPESVLEECRRISQFAEWTEAGRAYEKIADAYQTHLIQPEVIKKTKDSARTQLKNSKMSYKELAAAGNVSLSAVYRFMSGHDSTLSIETLFKMCKASFDATT